MRHSKTRLFLTTILAAFSLVVFVSAVPALAARRGGPAIVVFNAGWCASCRSVLPIARDIATQNSLAVQIIDIDAQDAPRQASDYGLSIPGSEPPQVYLVQGSHITLLFDAREYKYGQDDAIRATILNRLKQ